MATRLTTEMLDKWKDLPDDACLDSRDLHTLLGVKHLGALITEKLIPEPSHKYRQVSSQHAPKASGLTKLKNFYTRNQKLYWRLGVLRAFASINESNAADVLKTIQAYENKKS